MVTLYDVARMAGVSTATVSRVVHGQDRVKESTRARVQEVIEQLGYIPDGAAQSLSRRRKDVIGLIYVVREEKQNDIENMSLLYWDEILRGVEGRIQDDHRWSLLITSLRARDERDYSRMLSLTGKVDGLLIGEGILPQALLDRLLERVPMVIIAGNPGRIDVVKADNMTGGSALVTHLIEDHGRQRLFHVDGPPYVPDARERRLAMERVVKAHPGSALVGSYRGNFSVLSGEEAGESLLVTHGEQLPDAVVCANDQMAIGVLQAFARAGVHVPGQVAVTGFDDIYPGSLYEPSLTTVHQPMRLLGERACGRLLDRIASPALQPLVESLPTELVLRSSCGCPPGRETRRPMVQPAAALARKPAAQGLEARGPEARGPEARGPEARGPEARGDGQRPAAKG
jgi:LacI family transcriptional regulator